ncbi:unnamed protein product [Adineta ricciae]|uniref:Protein kinase domain-containing protein n=1 Tax=Adineta ricciae TaxID=249248 RepID=A0A813S8D6_ADIRI|nr:unnamed protein product [Adineta ricciae]
MISRTHIAASKVVLLTESNSANQDVASNCKYEQKLWDKLRLIVTDLHYCCETVELDKLDFQEYESVDKFLNAAIVIMDVTNAERRPTFMYHKGNRESINCMDDIVLIQANSVENYADIQDLKTTCKIKRLIVYRYDEKKDAFYDVTTQSKQSPISLKKSLRPLLNEAAKNMEKELSTRYLNLMEKHRNKFHDEKSQRDFLRKEICDEILTERNKKYATPMLIIKLMYAFRDIQDYPSMIELIERCEQYPCVSKNIQNNTMISYLTAFAHSRRNENNDRDKALTILERLCQTKRSENELSNDIICLCGRIYKDKYRESDCRDKNALEKAIEWYRKGFAADPNIYAGINLLLLLATMTDNVTTNKEAYDIINQLSVLLGKKSRSLRDLNDYWDVATYFELHAVRRDWLKACQAALHMYLLNPPIWHLKSTINNLTILHQATRVRDQQKPHEQSQEQSNQEKIYSFWMDFFDDAINSCSTSSKERELPAQIPILVCDNYEHMSGEVLNNIYVEALLQLNLRTSSGRENLVIRILEQQNQIHGDHRVTTIHMNSIRSIVNLKPDNRGIFLFASENSEPFTSVDMQLYFSSAERRTAFNEVVSKYRVETTVPEVKRDFELEFDRGEFGQRLVLGDGKYGRVYLARDRKGGEKVAVKEIQMRNSNYTEVLENEIKILSTLNHKNIVSYRGSAIGSSRGGPVFQIIMEYVDGGSLLKHLKLKPFSEESIQNYTRQLLEGVQYLHENRILHRDIKSANVLLNSKGEIKIADFGTSKRLAGLHRCLEDIVGTPPYMCPDVVVVPVMGYGPEVDIWSVGCTVIEMATGKNPFHHIANQFKVLQKLADEKLPPAIPPELSDLAKDFLARCFEPNSTRPSAKDLLNHSFLKVNTTLTRESSCNHVNDRSLSSLRLSDSSSSLLSSHVASEQHHKASGQISVDDRRRSQLATIFRDEDNEEMLIDNWMSFITEKRETNLLNEDKLAILLDGICDYLDKENADSLKQALDKICGETTIDEHLQMDLEQSFYLFIRAANSVLSQINDLPPYVLFALDNIVRRIAEQLVGFIRSDFIPAAAYRVPSTPNGDRANSVDESTNDEVTRLYQQYRKLADKNREKLYELINLERKNYTDLTGLVNSHRNSSSSEIAEVFLPADSLTPKEEPNPSILPVIEESNGSPITPMSNLSKGIKRSRALFELEQEHEALLKSINDNRTHLNNLLYFCHSS